MTNTDKRAGARRARGGAAHRASVSQAIPGWVFVVVGLTLGLVVFLVAQPDERPDKGPGAPETLAVSGGANTAEPVFDFYTSLPQRDMNTLEPLSPGETGSDKAASSLRESKATVSSPALSVAPDAVDSPSRPLETADPGPAGKGGFVLQAGSFQLEQDAVQLQSRLASSGLAAYVEAVDIRGSGRWYRVRVGPYDSRELALADRQQLVRLGVDSLVVSRK